MTEYKIIFYGLLGALLLGVLFLELVVRKKALAVGSGVNFTADENRLQRFWILGLLLCFALVFASRPRPTLGRPTMFKKKRSMPGMNTERPPLLDSNSKLGPETP